ncbi:MAG: AgmX/PglI C-terminal domain-containing protein [Deltaproteobacteria bacterium]|nr:AgmX/PglI C-terminal domain-containing protein [Deltaproteobacteria bacterium]
MRHVRRSFLGGVVLSLLACAAPQRPRSTPPSRPIARRPPPKALPKAAPDDGLHLKGGLGTLDQSTVEERLKEHQQEFVECFQRGLRESAYLGGAVTFKLRVGPAGAVKSVLLSESTLGSRPVEQCLLGVVSTLVFPRPKGGDAEFTYPLSFPSREQILIWDPGMVQKELKRQRRMLLARARGAGALALPKGLMLTFYVDRRGRAVSAGLAAPTPFAEDLAERLLQNLKKLKFIAPQGSLAKVTYRW